MTHLIGIGGVGMSALAEALIASGCRVSGSDRTLGTATLARLEALGAKIYPDDGSGITDEVDRVIVSTAIEETNAGLQAARARRIAIVHRAAALAEVLEKRKLVAVAGTCGKSTVTAMLAHVLKECGMDPLAVNGAAVVGWNGSVLNGKGEFSVAEVDESDKSLSAFHPYAAIITNASADHYSKEEMDEVFDAFVRNVKGPVIDGRTRNYEADTSLKGAHNRQNAGLALAMALTLGADEMRAREALKNFSGVERRMQLVGKCGAADVYDDYAHNPEKLRAMLTTLQADYRGVAVVWRPHGYGPLRKMKDALAAMFNATLRAEDRLMVLPVYDAGGTADRSIGSEELVAEVPGAKLARDLDEAAAELRSFAKAGAALVTAGARDPNLAVLAKRLTR